MSEQENQQPQGDETGGQVGEGAGLNSVGEQTEAERQQAEADEDDE